MWTTRVFGLLLPLGIWLVMSTTSSRDKDARIAISGILVFIIAGLAFYATGFAFMFGGVGAFHNIDGLGKFATYLILPVEQQVWALVGLRGFLLDGASAGPAMDLFISYLPLVASSAMLISFALSPRVNILGQALAVAVLCGVIFPVAGFWMWGGGWLAAGGTNLSLGHGSIDIGGLTTAALVTGGAGLAYILFHTSPVESADPQLPETHHPIRAVVGMACMIVGAGAFIGGNPLYVSFSESTTSLSIFHMLLAVSSAVLVVLIYTFLVARQPVLAFVGRGALAALIAVSAGASLIPGWLAITLGVLAGLLCSIGHYLSNRVTRQADDAGIISSVLLPALIGLLAIGLFANGEWAQGWNGVGINTYLGQSGLGVVGVFASDGTLLDPGQLTAQVVAVIALFMFSFLVFTPFAFVLRPSSHPLAPAEPVTIPAQSPVTVLQPEPTLAAIVTTPAFSTSSETSRTPAVVAPPEPVATSTPEVPMIAVIAASETSPRQPGVLQRLLHMRNTNKPSETPVQARRVAYPNRVRGRRIQIRSFGRTSSQPHPSEDGTSAN